MQKPESLDITSTKNERIKALCRLSKRSAREESGLFLIEGIPEIKRAIEGGIVIVEVCFCPDIAVSDDGRTLIDTLRGMKTPLLSVARSPFAKIAYREESGGLVAVARKPRQSLDDISASAGTPLYLVVDSVEKPGNLGALMRSADGAGATGVIMTDPGTDIFNPNAIRSSLGTVFTMPNAMVETPRAIRWFNARKVAIITTSPTAEAFYTEADFTGPSAIVVGSEDKGLGSAWLEASDSAVRIPMRGAADSLNVSVTAAILLYEALRQRQNP